MEEIKGMFQTEAAISHLTTHSLGTDEMILYSGSTLVGLMKIQIHDLSHLKL